MGGGGEGEGEGEAPQVKPSPSSLAHWEGPQCLLEQEETEGHSADFHIFLPVTDACLSLSKTHTHAHLSVHKRTTDKSADGFKDTI